MGMTRSRPFAAGAIALALISLAACGKSSTPEQSPSTNPASQAPAATPATVAPPAPVNLQENRLNSRDCATVAQFYGDAIRAGQYAPAARAWGQDAGADAAALEKRFSTLRDIKLDIGEAAEEGAAGSLYCTVQVTLRDASQAQPGSLTLRRVNDVPGATADQLRWHIVQSTLGEIAKPAS
jgi:hypothetical protein